MEVVGLRQRPAANEPVACLIVRSAVCTVAKVVRRSLQGCGIRLSKHLATVGLRHTRCEKATFCHKVCDASVSAHCVYLLMQGCSPCMHNVIGISLTLAVELL